LTQRESDTKSPNLTPKKWGFSFGFKDPPNPYNQDRGKEGTGWKIG